jgi:hypothetical protein
MRSHDDETPNVDRLLSHIIKEVSVSLNAQHLPVHDISFDRNSRNLLMILRDTVTVHPISLIRGVSRCHCPRITSTISSVELKKITVFSILLLKVECNFPLCVKVLRITDASSLVSSSSYVRGFSNAQVLLITESLFLCTNSREMITDISEC